MDMRYPELRSHCIESIRRKRPDNWTGLLGLLELYVYSCSMVEKVILAGICVENDRMV